MRKTIKAPMTVKALDLAIKKAEKLGLTKTADGLSQAKASMARTNELVSEGEKKCNKYLKSIETPIEAYNRQQISEAS